MMQKILCPSGHWLSIDNQSEGDRVKCPRCSAEVVVPASASDGSQVATIERSRSRITAKTLRSQDPVKSASDERGPFEPHDSTHGSNGHAAPAETYTNGFHLNGNGAHADGERSVPKNGNRFRSNASTLTIERPPSASVAAADTNGYRPPKSQPPKQNFLPNEAAALSNANALREAAERRNRKPRTYGVSLAIALFACLQVAPIFMERSFVAAPKWAQITLLLAGLEIVYAVWVALTPDWAAPRVAMLLFGFISTLYAVALGISIVTPPGKSAPLQLNDAPGSNVLWFLVMCFGALVVTHIAGWVSFSWRSRWSA